MTYGPPAKTAPPGVENDQMPQDKRSSSLIYPDVIATLDDQQLSLDIFQKGCPASECDQRDSEMFRCL